MALATLLQPASCIIAAAVALAVLPPGMVLRAADADGTTDAAAATGAAVAIRVGDSPIFRAELDATLRRALQGRLLGPQQRDRLTAETVEQLVDERLLRREIDVRKITVEEEEVSQIITRMRGQLADRKIPIETFLAQSGRDEASLRAQIRLELALTKMLRTHVTPEALDAAFTKNKRDLDGTLVRVSHIVLRPDPGRGDETVADMERRASAIRTAILRGELSFAAAATQHSAGPSRRQGGDLGFIPRHGGVDEEFSRRAFALAKGEISQPFATAFGVHVVLVTDIQPGNLGPAEVRTQVERMVVQEVIREIVGRGRRDTPIEYAPDVPHFAADSNRDDTARKVIVERPAKQQP